MENVSFDALIARKLQREQKRAEPVTVEVEDLGALTFECPKDAQLVAYLGRLSGNAEELYELFADMIYDTCPLFRAQKTREELGAVIPTDAVKMVLSPMEIMDVGNKISEAFGLFAAEEEAKN